MSNMDLSLKNMMVIDGALGAAVVDYNSGMALGTLGSSRPSTSRSPVRATPRWCGRRCAP